MSLRKVTAPLAPVPEKSLVNAPPLLLGALNQIHRFTHVSDYEDDEDSDSDHGYSDEEEEDVGSFVSIKPPTEA